LICRGFSNNTVVSDVFRLYLLYSNHGGRNLVAHFDIRRAVLDAAIVPRLFEFGVVPKLIPYYDKFLLILPLFGKS